MIRFTSEAGHPVCETTLRGYGVYLDNDSLIEFATRLDQHRQRFVENLQRKGALMFSFTNTIEISGPHGDSANAVRGLLDSIGPHWVPLELNPYKVAEKEKAGAGPERAAVSERFMTSYFQQRAYELSPNGTKVLDLSDTFFRLGAVLDWSQQNRDSIRADAAEIDKTLKERIASTRTYYVADPTSLDRELPPIAFDPQRPATFVLIHLWCSRPRRVGSKTMTALICVTLSSLPRTAASQRSISSGSAESKHYALRTDKPGSSTDLKLINSLMFSRRCRSHRLPP